MGNEKKYLTRGAKEFNFLPMKRLYLIKVEDFFKAENNLKENAIVYAGTIWIEIMATEEQAARYPFAISRLTY